MAARKPLNIGALPWNGVGKVEAGPLIYKPEVEIV
jgi:hypothetical protein